MSALFWSESSEVILLLWEMVLAPDIRRLDYRGVKPRRWLQRFVDQPRLRSVKRKKSDCCATGAASWFSVAIWEFESGVKSRAICTFCFQLRNIVAADDDGADRV